MIRGGVIYRRASRRQCPARAGCSGMSMSVIGMFQQQHRQRTTQPHGHLAFPRNGGIIGAEMN